ncbi:uncharacterized protein LOC116158684 [Photinus pyralis]|uniref:uncharacterized protein LOC116158684 n=1 Tax=Photinus pyralis TaxID=7054 RepID=UPI001266E830|nr:uncharacterized protein LOC116158684 [Photinus pyralis]
MGFSDSSSGEGSSRDVNLREKIKRLKKRLKRCKVKRDLARPGRSHKRGVRYKGRRHLHSSAERSRSRSPVDIRPSSSRVPVSDSDASDSASLAGTFSGSDAERLATPDLSPRISITRPTVNLEKKCVEVMSNFLIDKPECVAPMQQEVADVLFALTRNGLPEEKLNPSVTEAVKNSPISGLLFGENLSEQIRNIQALEKIGKDLVASKQNSQQNSKPLNSNRPSRAPLHNRNFTVSSKRGGGRTTFVTRSRYLVQKENQRDRRQPNGKHYRRRHTY